MAVHGGKTSKPKTMQRNTRSRKRTSDPLSPPQMYRVEGLGRRGVIRYVKVIGHPGQWRIRGMDGLNIVVRATTIEEALRRAKRQIPFRPIVIRRVTPEELQTAHSIVNVPRSEPQKNS